MIGNPNLKVFIGKTGEEVVGFCAIRKMDCQLLELAGIIVREDQTGKGIGNDLLEMAKKEAVESGFTTMLVKTESTNKRINFTTEERLPVLVSVFEVNFSSTNPTQKWTSYFSLSFLYHKG